MPDVGNTSCVTGNENDEALTWAGGRDPSHYETAEVKPPKVARPSKRLVSSPLADGEDPSPPVEDEDPPQPTSAVVLVSLGVLGGIYLLYTVGWAISWQRFLYTSDNELELVAFRVQQVLALLAPLLWFVATMLLTRTRKPVIRLLWLLLGAVILIPWSFVMGS